MDTLPGDWAVHQETRSRWMTTRRQDSYLVVLSHRKRTSTSRSMEIDFGRASYVHLCNQTVRNRLHEEGMWAREHQNWQMCHWRPVLFTNESRLSVSTNGRRVRVWRCQGERYSDCNIVEVFAMISWSLLSDRMQALWGMI